jgi:hypothetical protein
MQYKHGRKRCGLFVSLSDLIGKSVQWYLACSSTMEQPARSLIPGCAVY